MDNHDGQRALYRLAFDEAERLLDLQVAAIRDHLARAGSLKRDGLATLGVGLAILGLLLNLGVSLGGFGVIGILVAYGLTLVSIIESIRIHSGSAYQLSFGPNPRGLVRAVGRPGMTELRLLASLLEIVPRKVIDNDLVLIGLSRDNVRATRLLLAGIVVHLLALGYILGGSIHV